MNLLIGKSELPVVCTIIALINGGYNTPQLIYSQAERLFGFGFLSSVIVVLERYHSGPASLWESVGKGKLELTLSEFEVPQPNIIPAEGEAINDDPGKSEGRHVVTVDWNVLNGGSSKTKVVERELV